MTWFLTEYESHDVEPLPHLDEPDGSVGKYGSQVWARDWSDAARLCRLRRIGEVVVGRGSKKASGAWYRPPSRMLRPRMTVRQRMEFLHAVCWLSFLASRSVGLSAFDTLGDDGIMHQAIHAVSFGQPTHAEMRDMLVVIERRVPGYWPRRGA